MVLSFSLILEWPVGMEPAIAMMKMIIDSMVLTRQEHVWYSEGAN